MSSLDLVTLAILAATLALLLAAGHAARALADRDGARFRRRLAQLSAGAETGGHAAPSKVRLSAAAGPLNGLTDRLARMLPNREALEERLQRAGWTLSPGSYLAIGLLVSASAALGLLVVVPLPFALVVGAVTGFGLAHMITGLAIGRRRNRFLALFPEAIDLIVRGLRSGLPVMESIASVGRDLADPVGAEFRFVSDSVRVGRSVDDALWEIAGRLDLPEFNFFVVSLSVQRETGGNLGETLQNLSEILRRRQQMRLKVRAMASEARTTAFIIGSLPFIMFAVLYFMNPDYAMRLFTDMRGWFMVGAAVTSEVVGAAVMIRMARFEI